MYHNTLIYLSIIYWCLWSNSVAASDSGDTNILTTKFNAKNRTSMTAKYSILLPSIELDVYTINPAFDIKPKNVIMSKMTSQLPILEAP